MTVEAARPVALAPRATTAVRGLVVVDALIFVVALAARLGVTYARGGSFFDGAGYDPSVYYAAADAFVHGLLPYRDFTLLHPPGEMLLLSPVALIGRLTTDRAGFEMATGLSLLTGALNAVLVSRIAGRMGLRRSAAVVGGLLYAVTLLSARSEYAARLEVFGNFLLLLGILFYVRSVRTPSPKMSLLAGAALAASSSVKIWFAVPLVIVLLWHFVDRRPRRSLYWTIGGAALAAALIDGPFLALSGRSMVQMVVLDQFGRGNNASALSRASDLDLLNRLRPHASVHTAVACAVIAALVTALGVVLAWRTRTGRLPAALFLVQLAVLFVAPVYFSSYADYVMPAGCLCAAAAAHGLAGTRRQVLRRSASGLGWALVTVSALAAMRIELVYPPGQNEPSPDRYLQQVAASYRCVQSSSPAPLIALNVLSSDLQHGCQQWVDVSGRTYGVDRSPTNQPRDLNQRWQHDLLRYLRSGQAFVLADVRREGFSHRTLVTFAKDPPVARGDAIVLRVTVSPGQAAKAGRL